MDALKETFIAPSASIFQIAGEMLARYTRRGQLFLSGMKPRLCRAAEVHSVKPEAQRSGFPAWQNTIMLVLYHEAFYRSV